MFRSGEVDILNVNMADIASILADMGDAAVLRTFASTDWGTVNVTFNYTHKDSNYAELFNNINFRHAISIAVDRTELSELLFDGFLEPGQSAPQAGNVGYDEEWINKWTEYDVEGAKKLLDECGLVMGSDGYYDFADGSDFLLTFYGYLDSGAVDQYPILEQYYNAVGIKTAANTYFNKEPRDLNIEEAATLIGLCAPFVPIIQSAEWYGEFGTWYGTKGESGVEPTGDMAKLIEIYEKWAAPPITEEREAYNLEIYEIHKENLWTIAYLQSAGNYNLVTSSLKNYPEELVWADLYMYANIVHYETLYKAA